MGKLVNISINTGLDLKTRFVGEKKKRIAISQILFWCNVLCVNNDFQGTFVDFCCVIFNQDLKKELGVPCLVPRIPCP